ncbi:hypothetical protein MiSe_35440 [Microseira wollei NIES-4236]|uniref:Uncharacterized protein n=1 Tax=Microseira wollei NIES-4236 TaxID=2530354 RepID=A0AAV3XF88_9CYAN|nr:hypothetical protein MiSe_35440 [Microseira wollei NIES-4236]
MLETFYSGLQAHEVHLSLYSGCHFCCRYTNSAFWLSFTRLLRCNIKYAAVGARHRQYFPLSKRLSVPCPYDKTSVRILRRNSIYGGGGALHWVNAPYIYNLCVLREIVRHLQQSRVKSFNFFQLKFCLQTCISHNQWNAIP